MSNYAMGHAFSTKEFFLNFSVDKLEMSSEQCKEIYSDGSKRDLSASIFASGLKLIVDDIIENNVHFKFPGVGKSQGYMYMKRTEEDEFKRAFRNGKFRDVDFLTSDFCGYLLMLELQSEKRTPREKWIYLNPKMKLKITDHTNEGKNY